jgi:hypothetical protein
MELRLSDDEAEELRRLLTGALSELSSEIADTDNAQFVRELRAQRDLLRSVEQKLAAGGL